MKVTTVTSIDHILQQLDNLALQSSKTAENSCVIGQKKKDSHKATSTVTPQQFPPTPPPDIHLEYQVSTIPKLQHFSRHFTIWAMSNFKEMGQTQARYIDRLQLKKLKPKSFSKSLEQLNSGDSDGLAFALQLCDDNGTIQERYKVHPWGSELNSGAALILSYLLVEKEFRRQGIARFLIDALMEKAKKAKGGIDFMFVKPGVIKTDLGQEYSIMQKKKRDEVERRAYETAVRFYRSVGFRRVGGTKWFCLAMDVKHASHEVLAEEDFNPEGW